MMEHIPITQGAPPPSPPLNEPAIYLLDRKQVEHYWPRIEAELEAEPELWNNWWTLEAIFEGVINEVIQVWVVSSKEKIQAIFMSNIVCAPAGRILQVFWMRGHLPPGAVNQISLSLDHFGQHHNCFRLSVIGRRGWERILRHVGARFEGISLTRPLTHMARN